MKKRTKTTSKYLIIFITLATSLTSCYYSSAKNLDLISIQMSKEEVLKKMDSQGIARGSFVNKSGKIIELREYTLDENMRFFANPDPRTYWLYFCEGKLVQWGRAGDWKEAERKAYDINLNVSKP